MRSSAPPTSIYAARSSAPSSGCSPPTIDDQWDATAHPIVCLHAADPNAPPRVVGVVRIWEETPGQWWGGRLGVHPDFRSVGGVGRALVLTAVGTARAWGAQRFRATVQRANVAFFRRLHWRTLEELELFGQAHQLMEAENRALPGTASAARPRARQPHGGQR